VTAPELSETIEKIVKEERQRDLGRAGIETLSIIAYKGPVSKKEIEYIRGVNCQWALRSLLLRGLIEKKGSETDTRVILYTLTSETLRYLGLSHITDLPQYQEKQKQLEVLENTEGLEKEQYG
ncbi:MAG: Segregation and condensation protein B, partial [Parcubacteria group bacterium GW2011_GWA2_40_14]